jgi:hypothetical protein
MEVSTCLFLCGQAILSSKLEQYPAIKLPHLKRILRCVRAASGLMDTTPQLALASTGYGVVNPAHVAAKPAPIDASAVCERAAEVVALSKPSFAEQSIADVGDDEERANDDEGERVEERTVGSAKGGIEERKEDSAKKRVEETMGDGVEERVEERAEENTEEWMEERAEGNTEEWMEERVEQSTDVSADGRAESGAEERAERRAEGGVEERVEGTSEYAGGERQGETATMNDIPIHDGLVEDVVGRVQATDGTTGPRWPEREASVIQIGEVDTSTAAAASMVDAISVAEPAAATIAAAQEARVHLKPGDKVSARWRASGYGENAREWYPATVIRRNANGTFRIKYYKDGEEEDDVLPQYVREDSVAQRQPKARHTMLGCFPWVASATS